MKNAVLLIMLSLIGAVTYGQDKARAQVKVTDYNNVPIVGAQVIFFDTKKNTSLEGVSDANGFFEIDLSAGLYNIRLKGVGFTKDYSAIEIPALAANEVYNDVNIHIQYEEESSFTLTDLHFETGKAIIQPNSYNILDELVKYLELKPEIRVEIGGHTDNDGSEESNLVLSQKRAEAVKNYLVKKGIAATRIMAKGYGEGKPIAANDTAHGKALNRRTEVTVL